jgi:hypothetical protein
MLERLPVLERMNNMTRTTTAEIIFEQLGGGKFAAMTGAKNFIADNNTLRFNIGRNASRANKVEITLTADDLYTITFTKYTPYKFKINPDGTFTETLEKIIPIEKYEGVYGDILQNVFTQVTGLYTRLF